MNFHIVSIFPEFFNSPVTASLLGKAVSKGFINISLHNPRDFTSDRNLRVDDRPFGGGPGMILQLDPILKALQRIKNPGKIILLSPGGKELTAEKAKSLAREDNLTLICGRYEGVDQRLNQIMPIEEIRIGKVVLNGGETPALALMEAVSRFLPGFMHSQASVEDESLNQGVLEYPQYTRPATYEGIQVPEILLNGNHAEIGRWRREQSLKKTLEQENALLDSSFLDRKDMEFLSSLPRKQIGKNLSICLFHYPVYVEKQRIGASSLTNLDIHDISRICQSYGLGPFFVLTPIKNQLELLGKIVEHWTSGKVAKKNPDRATALKNVWPVENIDDLLTEAKNYFGVTPALITSSARWPEKRKDKPINFSQVRELLNFSPAILCFGTGGGLAEKKLGIEFLRLRPLRFLTYNHLSVRSAVAIIADRILGDYL